MGLPEQGLLMKAKLLSTLGVPLPPPPHVIVRLSLLCVQPPCSVVLFAVAFTPLVSRLLLSCRSP